MEGSVEQMQIVILSFGYQNGVPQDADIVMDVRFLPNPYEKPELRELTGLDQPVRDYILYTPVTRTFQTKLMELLRFLLLQYNAAGKEELTIAFGCQGGRHRSVVIAEYISEVLNRYGYPSSLKHRDLQTLPKNR